MFFPMYVGIYRSCDIVQLYMYVYMKCVYIYIYIYKYIYSQSSQYEPNSLYEPVRTAKSSYCELSISIDLHVKIFNT